MPRRSFVATLVLALIACGTSGNPSPAGGDMAASFPAARCASAADCRLYSSYCTTRPCQCLALGRTEVDPPCLTGNQSCLVDPCAKKSAACANGACVVE